jgi:hypothetical protein
MIAIIGENKKTKTQKGQGLERRRRKFQEEAEERQKTSKKPTKLGFFNLGGAVNCSTP